LKTLVQCDFDATLTIGEISHALLENFAVGDWKSIQAAYYAGRITVEECNTWQFAMIDAAPETLRDFLLHAGKVVLRQGVKEFLGYAKARGWELSIISNGLRFYIEVILEDMGYPDIEVIAAETEFAPGGLLLSYRGTDDTPVMSGFKAARAEQQRRRGYDTVYYIGDGMADLPPARHADHVFATSVLLEKCREEGLPHSGFTDLFSVINYFEKDHRGGP
jgi:2-hydroxy-3-keto-5-methylthiopentenyl-1-phosphate phosphatase